MCIDKVPIGEICTTELTQILTKPVLRMSASMVRFSKDPQPIQINLALGHSTNRTRPTSFLYEALPSIIQYAACRVAGVNDNWGKITITNKNRFVGPHACA